MDGTGASAQRPDVAVSDERVTEIGKVDGGATAKVIDADGLWVTPGFVDMHTHYDAQLLGPDGVSRLVARRHHRDVRELRVHDRPRQARRRAVAPPDALRVEGMSAEALQEAVDFEGGVGDLLTGLEARVGVNVGVNVGHSAVRRYVMDDDASERAATDDEVEAMRVLVRQAMVEGAVGFTSSQLDIHVAHDGRGVPSKHADPDEVVALASVLGEVGRGCIEFILAASCTGTTRPIMSSSAVWPRRRGGRCT